MKLFIEKVEVGAEYEDQIYNYWVTAKLPSGKKIMIFDHDNLELEQFVNREIECVLFALLVKVHRSETESQTDISISGKFVRKYVDHSLPDFSGSSALLTDFGVVFLDDSDDLVSIEEGAIVEVCASRYDFLKLLNSY